MLGLQVVSLNQARKYFAGGLGTQTAALAFGGNNPPQDYALTEQYDGVFLD